MESAAAEAILGSAHKQELPSPGGAMEPGHDLPPFKLSRSLFLAPGDTARETQAIYVTNCTQAALKAQEKCSHPRAVSARGPLSSISVTRGLPGRRRSTRPMRVTGTPLRMHGTRACGAAANSSS